VNGPKEAILLAGGIGSRMLPASMVTPKEALPLVDMPQIFLLAAEAKLAGVKTFHVVLSPEKMYLANLLKFDEGKVNYINHLRKDIDQRWTRIFDKNFRLIIHTQQEAKGVGDALMQALPSIEGEVLVMFGDNIILDQHTSPSDWTPSTASLRLVEEYRKTKRPIVGLIKVPINEIDKYGIVELDGKRIAKIVEKPKQNNAPSNLAICGRYIMGKDTRHFLETKTENWDMQSIDLLKSWIAQEGGLIGIELINMQWYDSGDPVLWLKAQVDHVLRRVDLQEEFLKWINHRISGGPKGTIQVVAPVDLVPLIELRPHEDIRASHLEKMISTFTKTNLIHRPILIDKGTGAILDGHHRFHAAQEMGLNYIPSIMVHYLEDPRVSVEAWPNSGYSSISKQEVIEMALSANLYPPKSTRHHIDMPIPGIAISLEELV